MAAKPQPEPDPIDNPSPSGLDASNSGYETPGNVRSTRKIGVECETAGITLEVLENGWSCPEQRRDITEMMAAEIEAFRDKNSQTYGYKDVRRWLSRLMDPEAFEGVSDDNFRRSLRGLRKKAQDAKKNSKKKGMAQKLQDLITNPYRLTPPQPQLAQPQPEHAQPQPSTSRISGMLESSRQQKQRLEKQVKQKEKEMKQMEVDKFALETEVQKMKRKREDDDNQLRKQKRLLLEREAKVKQKESEVNVKNWKEKLKRRDLTHGKRKEEVADLTKKCADLQEKFSQLQKKVQKLTKQKECQRVKLQYCRKKKATMQKELTELKKINKTRDKEMSQLHTQVENMALQLEEKEHSISLRNGPHANSPFTDDVRMCYMQLLSLEVSSRNVSKVVLAVLKTIGKFSLKLKQLPGETFTQLIRQEANLVATIQATERLQNAKVATLQSDGTSRDGKKVVGFQANTGKQKTDTLGVPQVPSGESADQLDAFKFLINKMATLTSAPENCHQKSKELVAKFKNTMADGAASQKMFNRLVEAYREEVLPDVIQNWSELDGPTKEKMISMNHLYCNLHALIGFATYADEALNKLESVWRKLKGSQFGVEDLKEFQDKEGKYAWVHADSATQRLIRTTCEALCPGGNQQAGRMKDFGHFLNVKFKMQRDTRMKVFRANRFNILFECAAGVFYHSSHVRTMFEEGYVKAGNKLLRAVLADISSEPLLAGCRALAIIYVHITEPYWRLVDSNNVHILDLTKSLQEVVALFQQWSRDATPLLQPDLPPVFSTPTGPLTPVKDELFSSLYSITSEEMTELTKQALEVIMANIGVVIQRRFKDQAALANSSDPTLRADTADMNKSNKRGENDFGYWSYLQTAKPSMGGMAAEGQLMFKFNSTDAWLEALCTEDPAKFKSIMLQARRERSKWHKKYEDRKKELKEREETKLQERATEHAANVRKKEEQMATQRTLLQKHGGPVSSEASCRDFLKQVSALTKVKQNEILRKQIQYIKATNPEMAKSNKLFVMSAQGQPHSIQQLSANLQAIVASADFTADTDGLATEPSTKRTAAPSFSKEDAEDEISRIKAQFAAKVIQVTNVQETVTVSSEHKRNDKDSETEGHSDDKNKGSDSDGEESEEEESDSDVEESEEEESDSDVEESEEEETDDDEKEIEEVDPDSIVRVAYEDDGDEKEIGVDSIVVVAYEEDWAVGEVTELLNSEKLSVHFMERTRKTAGIHVFYWPDRPVDYEVERKFVLTTLSRDQLQPSKGSNYRMALTEIKGWKELEKMYTVYYNKYFARNQKQPRATKSRAKKSS